MSMKTHRLYGLSMKFLVLAWASMWYAGGTFYRVWKRYVAPLYQLLKGHSGKINLSIINWKYVLIIMIEVTWIMVLCFIIYKVVGWGIWVISM